jgi:hypothetical protein
MLQVHGQPGVFGRVRGAWDKSAANSLRMSLAVR